MLDLVVVHHGVLRQDFFQQHPELRDVPLAVAQRVDWTALNVLPVDLERQIERAARGDDLQVLIEDQERRADRIHDRLCERASIIDVHERLAIGRGQCVCRDWALE